MPRAALLLVLVPVVALAGGAASAQPVDPAEQAYRDGAAALRAEDHATAAAALERAAALRPADGRVLFLLGLARSGLRDWTGAIEAYEALLRIEPAHARGLHNLSNVHYRQGRYPEAATYYARAIEADPQYLLALFHHGRVLWQMNRAAEATGRFESCLAGRATNDEERSARLECAFYLGTLRFRARDLDGAAAILQQVLATHPRHVEAHYYLAMVYRELGRLDEARRLLDEHRRLLDAARPRPIEKRRQP
jgi:tetratricopeptide (TPR) repeat protein